MSTAYESTGRTRQKQRTRDQLVAAARSLIADGGTAPTVEQAAAAALISRTTAYRYFPNQRALLVAAHPEVDTASLLPDDPVAEPELRLGAAVRAFTDLIVDTEDQQRTMLRLSLEDDARTGDLPLRQGRAIAWFTEALTPLADALGEDGIHRLAVAVRSAVGIEALVWLTDVAGLSRADAVAVQQWSAQALLEQAVRSGPPPA